MATHTKDGWAWVDNWVFACMRRREATWRAVVPGVAVHPAAAPRSWSHSREHARRRVVPRDDPSVPCQVGFASTASSEGGRQRSSHRQLRGVGVLNVLVLGACSSREDHRRAAQPGETGTAPAYVAALPARLPVRS